MGEAERQGGRGNSVDCVYIAAFSGDPRFTRICVASVRYFYPAIPIRILPGSPLDPGLVRELNRYWNTGVADIPAGTYGWGFVKLEPLFGPPGERFLVLDADTVMAGPVLDLWQPDDAPLLVDEEEQPEHEIKRLYFDWEKVGEVLPDAKRPQFVFNSGQWFATAGALARDDFSALLEWTMPRKLLHPKHFMPGDQGILNYLFNARAARDGLRVQRRKIMFWPVWEMDGMNAAALATRTAPALVVHWAGLKKRCLRHMVRADMLTFFEKYYYERIPLGSVLRPFRATVDVIKQWLRDKRVRVRMRFAKFG